MAATMAATLIASARKRIAAHFRDGGALSRDLTLGFAPENAVEKHVFARMVKFGALVEARPGQYWLDERRYADFRKESLARVLGAIALAGFAAAGAIALGG